VVEIRNTYRIFGTEPEGNGSLAIYTWAKNIKIDLKHQDKRL
jgi:hypothetical protein